jgi:hypothetical protein
MLEIELEKFPRRTLRKINLLILVAAAILYKAKKTIFKYDYEKDSMHFMNVRSELKNIKRRVELGKF